MTIAPGTIAAIAASLMAQGEHFGENADIRVDMDYRRHAIRQYVQMAVGIADETTRQMESRKIPAGVDLEG